MKKEKMQYGYFDSLIEEIASSKMQDKIVNGAKVQISINEQEHCYVLEVTEP